MILDGDWQLWSHDPITGKRVWYLEDDTTIIFRTETPVTDIIEDNKASFNASDGRRWGDGQVAASIPLDFYYRHILPARKAGDSAYIKRILNDPDYRAFRTFKGTV